MCNLYSMTRNREAVLRLCRVSHNRAQSKFWRSGVRTMRLTRREARDVALVLDQHVATKECLSPTPKPLCATHRRACVAPP